MSYFEQIFTRCSHRHFVLFLFAVSLAGLFGVYVLLTVNKQQHHSAQLRNRQLTEHITSLHKKVSALPVTVMATPVAALPVFSVLETLRKSGGRLISWQPGERQAMLELALEWENIPYFFNHISTYQCVHLHSFTISYAKDSIVMALSLGFSDENT